VQWESSSGDGNWKTIYEGEVFRPSYSERGLEIRATVSCLAAAPIFDQSITTGEFATNSIRVTKPDQTVKRFASAMKRTGRAQFDATLKTGENASASFEGGQLVLRKGNSLMMRAPVSVVQVDVKGSILVLKSTHGYETELMFAEKVMAGGMRFKAEQVRDLFIETLSAFKG
jgi:hypothetical protein